MDAPLSDTTARVEVRATAVSRRRREDTPLGRRGRSLAAGGAAPGAAPRPGLSLAAEDRARTSLHTDRTPGTVQTALTPTAEPDAAHGATPPSARGDETRRVSWKLEGSRALVRGLSRTTDRARPRPARPAVLRAEAAVAATAAAAGATAGAGVAAAHARTTATTAATTAPASEGP